MAKPAFGVGTPWAEPAYINDLESPYYNKTHRHLRRYVRNFIDENILPHQLEWEAAGEAPRDVALKYTATGIPHRDVPRAYRPRELHSIAGIDIDDLDAFHMLVMTDETSRVEGGVMVSLSGASLIGAPPSERRLPCEKPAMH